MHRSGQRPTSRRSSALRQWLPDGRIAEDCGSSDFFAPVLEGLFHQGHELVGDSAVDQTMIVTEREVDKRTDGDGIVAIVVSDDDWRLGNSAYAHDGRVRLINDRQPEDRAKLAGVGDSEGRAFDFFRFQLLVSSAFAKIGDAPLQAEKVEVVGI